MDSFELAMYAASISICSLLAIDNRRLGRNNLFAFDAALVGFDVGIVFALCVLKRG